MKRLALIITLFSSSFVFAQEQSSIKIKGITTDGKFDNTTKLDDVCIHIYKFNDKIVTYYSNKYGEFEFEVEMNSYIVLEFEKEKYFSKRILFDTRNKDIDYNKKYIPFNFEIMMLAKLKDLNHDEYIDFPITRIEYSEKEKDFYYVEKYTEEMVKKQEKIMGKLARLD